MHEGQRRDAIPMQRGFIYAQTGNTGIVYPYAKRVYLCTRGNAEMLSLWKEGLSIYKRVKAHITIQEGMYTPYLQPLLAENRECKQGIYRLSPLVYG
jgi:hypothetical protein